jgi:hypothetical protein
VIGDEKSSQCRWQQQGNCPAAPTLAITWSQDVIGEEDDLAVAAQVHGGVREWQECLV